MRRKRRRRRRWGGDEEMRRSRGERSCVSCLWFTPSSVSCSHRSEERQRQRAPRPPRREDGRDPHRVRRGLHGRGAGDAQPPEGERQEAVHTLCLCVSMWIRKGPDVTSSLKSNVRFYKPCFLFLVLNWFILIKAKVSLKRLLRSKVTPPPDPLMTQSRRTSVICQVQEALSGDQSTLLIMSVASRL